MKYLDDTIIITIPDLVVTKNGTYVYNITCGSSVVFYGNVFLSAGQTSVDIDITEIAANQKWNPFDYVNLYDNHNGHVELIDTFTITLTVNENTYTGTEEVALIYRYPNRKAALETTIVAPSGSALDYPLIQGYNVATGTQNLTPVVPFAQTDEYPLLFAHAKGSATSVTNYYVKTTGKAEGQSITEAFQTGSNALRLPLSKVFDGVTPKDHPTAEVYNSDFRHSNDYGTWNYNAGLTAITGDHLDEEPFVVECNGVTLKYEYEKDTTYYFKHTYHMEMADTLRWTIGDSYFEFEYTESDPVDLTFSFEWTPTTGDLDSIAIDFTNMSAVAEYTDTTLDDPTIDLYGDTNKLYTIAKVDLCPEHYYLLWQDRYGSFQSQPFKCTTTFSESVERGEVNNIYLQRRLNTADVQPKWQINSGWLDFDLIPYYESIYVSPVLLLYDAKEDKSYPVMITDTDYTERTFKNNSRQLFNLQLNLELSKKQNIIY